MQSVPINSFDPDIEVLIIRGPNNHITIGPIFQQFKRLEILRITDSLVPSVGTHSFWGVPSLTILGGFLISLLSLAFEIYYYYYSSLQIFHETI